VRVIGGVEQARAFARALARPLGLVPTMGALHDGHLGLVRAARRECASVAVSVFVNPTQFGPREDFAAYPRDLERDLALLRNEGVDLVYTPSVDDVYPPGFSTYVTVEGIGERIEGAARPGHFRGVATVVAKLFTVIAPDRAYFGQKDGQQTVVVTRMARDLDLPVQVVVLPTVREPDGLAMSSRNVYLSPDERRAAPALYRALESARALFDAGERDAERLRARVREDVAAEPSLRLEYVSVADQQTMQEFDRVDRPALLSLAAHLGRTRLIDNVQLVPPEGSDGAH
jgi:pantoate--beta-alanine ligase